MKKILTRHKKVIKTLSKFYQNFDIQKRGLFIPRPGFTFKKNPLKLIKRDSME